MLSCSKSEPEEIYSNEDPSILARYAFKYAERMMRQRLDERKLDREIREDLYPIVAALSSPMLFDEWFEVIKDHQGGVF